jgi:uncharacterized membrane protein YbhN (UPF0104 family)
MNWNLAVIRSPAAALWCTAAAAACFALNVYLSSFAWKQTLEFLYGRKIGYGAIRSAYVRSNIGKYVGGVMNFAGRNALCRSLGFSHFDMAMSSVIEVLSLAVVSLLLSLAFAGDTFFRALSHRLAGADPVFLASVAAAALLLIAALAVFAVRKGYLRTLRRLFTLRFLRLYLLLLLLYGVTQVVPGLLFVLVFTKALGTAFTLQQTGLAVAAYMISWLIGYIVPGAPGGIGVREAVLLFILSPYCRGESIVVAMTLIRLASIVGDVLPFFAESLLVLRRRTRGRAPERK